MNFQNVKYQPILSTSNKKIRNVTTLQPKNKNEKIQVELQQEWCKIGKGAKILNDHWQFFNFKDPSVNFSFKQKKYYLLKYFRKLSSLENENDNPSEERKLKPYTEQRTKRWSTFTGIKTTPWAYKNFLNQ